MCIRDRFNINSRGKQYTGIAVAACAAFFLSDPNTWTTSDIVIVGDKYYRECISLQTNANTKEQSRKYLAMMDLQSRLYFNNRWINLNVRFDILMAKWMKIKVIKVFQI